MAESGVAPPVLLVSGEYPPDRGGVGDYTARLRHELEAAGVRALVLTHVGDGEGVVPGAVRHWDWRALAHVARAAPRGGIVHLQYQAAAFRLRGEVCLLPAVLRRVRPDVRVATTFHDARVPYLFPGAGSLRWLAVSLLARFSHAVFGADPADLELLGGPSARHHLVPIGANVPCAPPAAYDRAAFRRRLGLGENDLAVAYFGFLNASKGLDALLATFERVAREVPAARLFVLGGAAGASDATDPATAAAFGARVRALANRVERPGFLAAPELSAYLLAMDVALLPYADGASPRRGSLLACAEHSLPIVTTAGAGCVPPLAGAVLAVEPGDVEGLAEAVLRVARDASLRAALRAGSARIAQAVTWEGIVERHLAIYASLATR